MRHPRLTESSPSGFKRTRDSAHVNRIVNDPTVHPYISLPGQGRLDAAPLLADKHNVCLVGEHGCFIFERHEPGVYEVHTTFLPDGRGKYALVAAQWARRYMFVATDAMELLTKVPRANIRAAALTRRLGFSHEFTLGGWEYQGRTTPIDFYVLRYPQWLRCEQSLAESGEWFHQRLEELGHSPDHDDDLVHDRYVGATVQMILAGQVGKGIVLYNRWARFSGYQTIALISATPLVIDIVDAQLSVKDYDIEVVECQLALQSA